MLKRSYRGFVLWMAGYFVLMISASFLPIKDNELQARIFYFLTAASVEVLMLIVYKTEKVKAALLGGFVRGDSGVCGLCLQYNTL